MCEELYNQTTFHDVMTTATTVGELTTMTVIAMTIEITKKTRIGAEITVMTLGANNLVKMTTKSIRSKGPLVAAITKRTTIKP